MSTLSTRANDAWLAADAGVQTGLQRDYVVVPKSKSKRLVGITQMESPLRLSSEWIGRQVVALIDRPFGTYHPRWPGILYVVNYGYVPGTLSGDGKPVDVYIVGEDRALTEVVAYVVGIIHREDDIEDKLVAALLMCELPPDDIMKQVQFVEQYFTVTIETPIGRVRYDRGSISAT